MWISSHERASRVRVESIDLNRFSGGGAPFFRRATIALLLQFIVLWKTNFVELSTPSLPFEKESTKL